LWQTIKYRASGISFSPDQAAFGSLNTCNWALFGNTMLYVHRVVARYPQVSQTRLKNGLDTWSLIPAIYQKVKADWLSGVANMNIYKTATSTDQAC
jgi:hypothetical protein